MPSFLGLLTAAPAGNSSASSGDKLQRIQSSVVQGLHNVSSITAPDVSAIVDQLAAFYQNTSKNGLGLQQFYEKLVNSTGDDKLWRAAVQGALQLVSTRSGKSAAKLRGKH